MKMKDGTAMSNHINDLNTFLCQATLVGMTQDDESKATILLCSLPDSWDLAVTSISFLFHYRMEKINILDDNSLVVCELTSI